MNSFPICEELHQAIECMITGNTQDGIPPAWLGDVSELLEVAKDLRSLPRPAFRHYASSYIRSTERLVRGPAGRPGHERSYSSR